MVFGGLAYALFQVGFLHLNRIYLLLSSAVLGIGAAGTSVLEMQSMQSYMVYHCSYLDGPRKMLDIEFNRANGKQAQRDLLGHLTGVPNSGWNIPVHRVPFVFINLRLLRPTHLRDFYRNHCK